MNSQKRAQPGRTPFEMRYFKLPRNVDARSFGPRLKRSEMTRLIEKRWQQYGPIWSRFVRGDVHRIRPAKTQGHEQRGHRYAVVVQSDDLALSTVVVVPTSTSCRPTSFRPKIRIEGHDTYAMAEQVTAVDWGRLGEPVYRLPAATMNELDHALDMVFGR